MLSPQKLLNCRRNNAKETAINISQIKIKFHARKINHGIDKMFSNYVTILW